MKKRNIVFALGLAFIGLTSCTNDSDRVLLDDSTFVAPVFKQELTQNFVVTEANLKTEIGTWSWTKAEFGLESPVKYEILVDTLADMSTAKIFTSSDELTKTVTVEDANKAAMLFYKESKAVDMYFALRSSLGTAAVEPAFMSQSQKLSFTCMFVKSLPVNMYMTGADFGNWNWDGEGTIQLIPVNGIDGAFWTIQYMTAEGGVKWSPVKDWAEAFGNLETSGGITLDGDGNAHVDADGLYMIYIDTENQKLMVETPKVYGIGDAFGGWGAGDYPFAIDGDKMTITTTRAGNLRMYAASSIADVDWWRMEFNIFGTEIVYRGRGGDQEAVPVVAGKKAILDFRTGEGVIK